LHSICSSGQSQLEVYSGLRYLHLNTATGHLSPGPKILLFVTTTMNRRHFISWLVTSTEFNYLNARIQFRI